MGRYLLRIVTLALIFSLMACSIVLREPKDGPPSKPFDVSRIPDAQPKPVVRTRAGNAHTYEVFGQTYSVLPDSRGYRARGMASWYGTKFHGRKTANGEIYNMYAMTAAHKTLPIPSYVRVTRVSSGQSIVVRINDRGPFKDNRLIDLSYAAAKKLGIHRDGVALVEVTDVTPLPGEADAKGLVAEATPAPLPHSAVASSNLSDGYQLDAGLYLQLGAFQQRKTAVNLQSQILAMLVVPVKVVQGQDSLHRVTLGPTDNEQKILAWQRILEANGMDVGFIVRNQ